MNKQDMGPNEIRECFAEMTRRGWRADMAFYLTVAQCAHYWAASHRWATQYVTDALKNA